MRTPLHSDWRTRESRLTLGGGGPGSGSGAQRPSPYRLRAPLLTTVEAVQDSDCKATWPSDSARTGRAALVSSGRSSLRSALPSSNDLPMSGMFSRAQVRRVLQRVPGKQRFGVYRFLPFFFVLGGTMEWIMIKVRVGQETFCKWGCSSLRFFSSKQEAAKEPFCWEYC